MKGFAGLVLALASGVSAQSQNSVSLSSADIRKILIERLAQVGQNDDAHRSIGIVVGIIDPDGRRIVSYGAPDRGDSRPLNGDTIFEIGSVTKVFTSLLLADMVQRGEVALTDPVSKYLTPEVKMPERGGRTITLQDLATHTSGLPRLPGNMLPKNAANPYADYTVTQLYEFLSAYSLPRDIGSQYEYSNLGGGLLGHVLARRAGMDYETLVRSRICGPLQMTSTAIVLSPELKARLAVGHDAALNPVANWDLPTLAGAGALRSSTNDLLSFLAANLGYTPSPLAPAMAAMLNLRRPTGTPNLEIALGWHVFTRFGNDIIWHNGGTGGYLSFIGYNPKTRAGVVVLSNEQSRIGIDDIGYHLLDARYELIGPPKRRTEISVDPKLLERLTGRYELAPSFVLTVTRQDTHLFAQATGQGLAEIFPETPKDFFYKIVDAQITFDTAEQGPATALTLHQNGRDIPGKRIGDAPPERHEVAVDPKLFDGYVGRYPLASGFELTITREADRLFVQATGQPKFELFAETSTKFFLKAVDAQITFVTDAQGKASSVVLHQNGRDLTGPRAQ